MLRFAFIRNPDLDKYILEYTNPLFYYLKESGHGVIPCTWDDLPETFDVGLFFNLADTTVNALNNQDHLFVLMNIEQLTRSKLYTLAVEYFNECPNLLHVDYSSANIGILHDTVGISNSFHLPPLHTPNMPKAKQYRKSERSIDLLFYGSISDNRLSECIRYGATQINAFNDERDICVRESKAVLNTHYDETYNIFESLRVYDAIYNGTPVLVTDTSLPENHYLSDESMKYIVNRLEDIPEELPRLDFVEENAKSRNIVDNFINFCHLSLPRHLDPYSSSGNP